MDHSNYTSFEAERQKGKHLTFENRCEIKVYHSIGYSNRRIAKLLNCSPSTVANELHRGTKTKKTNKGRPTAYSAKNGQKTYDENRKRCGRKPMLSKVNEFTRWVCHMIRDKGWSLDACAGYAHKQNLYEGERTCSKTLYNALHAGLLGLTLFDVPEVLSRKKKRSTNRKNKRILGKSIDERPKVAALGTEFGHWEIDTVVGKRDGKEAVVLTLVEKMTHQFIAKKIPGKDVASVKAAMGEIRALYGDKYSTVFKTITADNGSEFAELAEEEVHHVQVYFAHPYSSWERAQNERHNRILRTYLPKGKSIEQYTDDEIEWFADEMNNTPRKSLGYGTPDELFEKQLDAIYAA